MDAESVTEAAAKKARGIPGAVVLLAEVMCSGEIPLVEAAWFWRVVPDGKELWAMFMAYRDSSEERDQRPYGHLDFAREILRDNPVSQEFKDAAAALARASQV